MRYISCKLDDLKKIVLPIGYEGENEHTRVQVDAGEVFKEYPAAVPTLKVHGPTGAIYPAEVTRDGKNVIWDIKASDCAADGSGEAQFTFTLNNVIVKSCIAKIKVYRSIVGGSTPPDPVQDWLDEAQDVLDDLEAAEVHQPMIGVDGYWYTWDQENEEYTKTETKAQGEDGQQGPAGQDGAPGQDATPALITVNYSDLTFPVAKDTQCYHDGLLYYAKQDIQTSEAWTAAHWQQTTVEEQQRLLLNAIHGVEYSGKLLKNPVKSALINLFDHIVFTDGNAQIYIDALKDAWKPDGTLDSITAVFTQGSAVIYTTDSLDTLRQYLVVTGTYIKDSVEFEDEITDYTLSGTLVEGTSTITVTYGEETATFTVTVTAQSDIPSIYQKVEYIGATGEDQYIIFSDIAPQTRVDVTKYEFDIDFKFDEWKSGSNTNIMASFSTDAGAWIGYNNGVTAICMGTGTGCYFTDNDPTTRHSYHYSVDGYHAEFLRDDDESIKRNFSSDSLSSWGFCLFSGSYNTLQRNPQFDFKGKIYGLTMTYNDEPLLDLVPCYRKSDDVRGFYDKIGNTFYTNTGAGTFTKGSDVNV